MKPLAATDNILIIKLAALGDFVQALGPMQAIRRHHPNARLTLLTTAPFEPLAALSGWFDGIWLDSRPKWHQPVAWLSLRRRLRRGHFRRVYDLQTSDRSSGYLKLWWPDPRPEWSGIAAGCSHRHANPDRDRMHTLERQAEQLVAAGIEHTPPPDLDWLDGDVDGFDLPARFALIAPGGAPHRPDKRWPAERYRALAENLAARDIMPVSIGTPADGPATAALAGVGRDLVGATDLLQLAGLARRAMLAIGNDTGPMHLAAAIGCPTLVLYSHASDPALCLQRGPNVAIVRRPRLEDLSLEQVTHELEALVDGATS